MKASVQHKIAMRNCYRNPAWAAGFLNTVLEEEDWDLFLGALKDIADAQGGGISEVARKAKLNREHLYRMLSSKGHPKAENLKQVLAAMGFLLQIVPAKNRHGVKNKKGPAMRRAA